MLPLRQLPAIDRLLNAPELQVAATALGLPTLKQRLRGLQAEWRAAGEAPDWADQASGYAALLHREVQQANYRRVFNLTGVLIHTNLGRSPLPTAALDALIDVGTDNVALEFDLDSGRRGRREDPVTRRLAALTGAEAATVINNNAAALILVLNTFARKGSVPVSRGELIEIGGSFRLPELMERADCQLLEVGTTNRTRIGDYAAAIQADTGLLMKVHPSNFYIGGFTEAATDAELAELAREHQLPYCVDLGSGTLVDLADYGLPHEPMPQESLRAGADLVTFSGDKLLGGVQAGLIVGRADLIAALDANPLKRALRCDKLTLAALAATLKLYEEPDNLTTQLPLLMVLTRPLEVLEKRAAQAAEVLREQLTAAPGYAVAVSPSDCQIGSGALPDRRIDSIAVRIEHAQDSALRWLQERLRQLPTPIIGRVQSGALWLDTRSPRDWDAVLTTLQQLGDVLQREAR